MTWEYLLLAGGYLLYGMGISTLCYRDVYLIQLIQNSDKYRMNTTKNLRLILSERCQNLDFFDRLSTSDSKLLVT